MFTEKAELSALTEAALLIVLHIELLSNLSAEKSPLIRFTQLKTDDYRILAENKVNLNSSPTAFLSSYTLKSSYVKCWDIYVSSQQLHIL